MLLALTACAHGDDRLQTETNQDGTAVNTENSVKMIALITAIDERITVEVLQSPYTSGIHWVLTPAETVYLSKDGTRIEREDMTVGDTVEILYNGQVMMSYPPQIVAKQITRIS